MPEEEITESTRITPENITKFVDALVAWHSARIAILKQAKEVPEGTELIKEEDGLEDVTEVVAGDYARGFRDGISVALMEFEEFPFDPGNHRVKDDESPQVS